MNRRDFIANGALAGAAVHLGQLPSTDSQAVSRRPTDGLSRDMRRTGNPRSLIMDAMGELRFVYGPELIGDMLDVGMDSITITLCDPKPTGAEALELAVDSLLEHDRYLAEHPEFFVRATSVAHVDEARRSGRMAVFYLYQNTVQFGEDVDRIDPLLSPRAAERPTHVQPPERRGLGMPGGGQRRDHSVRPPDR